MCAVPLAWNRQRGERGGGAGERERSFHHPIRMSCAVASPVLEPSRDFSAWLEAQGVNAEVARAMDSELGIRDYGVLRACVGDGLVRAELLATARDRLPFGFYAVLRQVVKALQGTETHDSGAPPRWDDATASPGDVTLGGLVDVLLTLFSGLSRELLLSARRLGDADDRKYATASPSYVDGAGPENFMATETEDLMENEDPPVTQIPDRDSNISFTMQRIKAESPRAEPTATQTLAVDSGPSGGLRLIKVEHPDGGGFPAGPSQLVFQTERTAADYTPHSSLQSMELHDEVEEMTSAKVLGVCTWSPTDRGQQLDACQGGGFTAGPSQLGFQSKNAAGDHRPHAAPQSGGMRGETWGFAGQGTSGLSATPPLLLAPPRPLYSASGSGGVGGGSAAKEKEKPYSCKVCLRAFSLKTNLQVHLRTHTGEKPYRCDVCSMRFMMKPNLIVHQRRVHTGEKPYHCEECGLNFIQHCTLIRHLRTHARVEPGGAHKAAGTAPSSNAREHS